MSKSSQEYEAEIAQLSNTIQEYEAEIAQLKERIAELEQSGPRLLGGLADPLPHDLQMSDRDWVIHQYRRRGRECSDEVLRTLEPEEDAD